ncbi:hypothetical protein EBQ10_03010 [Trueperella pyogenes]|uniref:Uncharacterized protein n=1 Tax=Trueperella pyogenes TaxID=1661 RepID=A0A3Q9GHL2_9ACTO|nr:hypothetical protein [Trueperella pyogenes]AZR06361.1 hypothetical protein EBQ10_03010 [Trueperella pyogenes]
MIHRLVHAYYARKRRKEMDTLFVWAKHYYLLGDFDLATELLHRFYEMQKSATGSPACSSDTAPTGTGTTSCQQT